jgi:outer membrane biosynthesis protein TonB
MTRILSNRSRRILASCLGTLLLFILLLLASMEGGSEVERPPKIHMHDVQMYKPPPPPPPPPMEQNSQDSPMPSLTKAYAEDPVKLDFMELEVNMEGMEGIAISGFGTGGPGGGGGDGLGRGRGGWGTVALPELDKIPMVISAPPMEYPKEAFYRNILEFRVELHIVIDEVGRTYPIRILRNPFPSINKEILEFASEVVFTPPTKQGVPVKAEYLWPVVFQKR